jgi:hypothetical protein
MNQPASPAQSQQIPREFAYPAGTLVFRLATMADEGKLRTMLRDNHMDSWAQITLEREPEYFAAKNLFGREVAIIAEQQAPPHAPVCMYSFALLQVHVNGVPVQLGYVGHLRVERGSRHRIQVLKKGYQALKQFTQMIEPAYSFTSIASENTAAIRILNANLKGMPIYTPQGAYQTLAISTLRPRENMSGDVRPACAADIPELVSLYNRQARRWQFAPVLSEQWLASLDESKGLTLEDFLLWRIRGKLVACVALWDQRKLKQTVARAYRPPIGQLRWLYNRFARLTGRVELPAIGQPLQGVYLAFPAFEELSDRAIIALVNYALARGRDKGAKVCVIGLSPMNPHCQLLEKHFNAVSYHSQIETVSWPEHPLPELDTTPPQPEVALL